MGQTPSVQLSPNDLVKEIELLKLQNQIIFIVLIGFTTLFVVRKVLDVFYVRKREDRKDLTKYRNLPIPDFPILTYPVEQKAWFELYEMVMGTDDKAILKLCLGYYFNFHHEKFNFSERAAILNMVALSDDYNQVKEYLTKEK